MMPSLHVHTPPLFQVELEKDFVMSVCNGWISLSWVFCSNLDNKASFPGALSALSVLSFVLIMSLVISRVDKVSVSDPVKAGIAVGTFPDSSLVNADENIHCCQLLSKIN